MFENKLSVDVNLIGIVGSEAGEERSIGVRSGRNSMEPAPGVGHEHRVRGVPGERQGRRGGRSEQERRSGRCPGIPEHDASILERGGEAGTVGRESECHGTTRQVAETV